MRFLPRAIGNIILAYTAYVLPLRQTFLRQQTPGALVSPCLWAHLHDSVWPDDALSRCLGKACARARVPRLHTSNWRQLAAAITKEKFSPKERANFDLGFAGAGVVDLVALAELSNHSYRSFNHAYAGATQLTMSTLLHRNYRASSSWCALFRLDQLLERKQARSRSGSAEEKALPRRVLEAKRRAIPRAVGAHEEVDLLQAARALHNSPGFRFREPGQRRAVLAVLGPERAEQVVVVLGTGTGKSLLFVLSASAPHARTTIVVLPMVILRSDMLRRLRLLRSRSEECGPARRPAPRSSLCRPRQRARRPSSSTSRARLPAPARPGLRRRVPLDHYGEQLPAVHGELGWHVRQLRTQTVWLTATLPPIMQEELIAANKLVRPRSVREPTNRHSVTYAVHQQPEEDQCSLVEYALDLLAAVWEIPGLVVDESRDKVLGWM